MQKKELEAPTSTKAAVSVKAPKSRRAYTGFGSALLGILAMCIYAKLTFNSVVVSGDSMSPTLPNGTRLLVSKAYWLVGPVKDKDIIVIKENNATGYIIKRVYKMAGEVVDWYNVPRSWSLNDGEYRVPAHSVFVLGDNRSVSEDSRYFGAVDTSRILGKVVVRPNK